MNSPRSIFTAQKFPLVRREQPLPSPPAPAALQRRYSTSSVRDPSPVAGGSSPTAYSEPPAALPTAPAPPVLTPPRGSGHRRRPLLRTRTGSELPQARHRHSLEAPPAASSTSPFLPPPPVRSSSTVPTPSRPSRKRGTIQDHQQSPKSSFSPPFPQAAEKQLSASVTHNSDTDYAQKKPRLNRTSRQLINLNGVSIPPPPQQQSQKHQHSTPSYSPSKISPTSPLFFSDSPGQRPRLPPRFSSSEAGAKMLSKTKGEDSGIKTVTLARGTPTAGSPPSSRHPPRSRSSVDRWSSARSTPELAGRPDLTRTLSQIGIAELLENDDRPTFIVDLGDATNYTSPTLHLAYVNPAVSAYVGLLELLSHRTGDVPLGSLSPSNPPPFKAWVLGTATAHNEMAEPPPRTIAQYGLLWSQSTLRKRIRIVSGTSISAVSSAASPIPTPVQPRSDAGSILSSPSAMTDLPLATGSSAGLGLPPLEEQHDYFGNNAVTSVPGIDPGPADASVGVVATVEPIEIAYPEQLISPTDPSILPSPDALMINDQAFFDWTRLPNTDALPPHIQFARNTDWGSTCLGPIETWSSDLRQMCNLIMASPHPAAMYWGDDYVAIYNEAYVLLAGQKHPQLMGQSYSEAWAEIWDEIEGVFTNAKTTGQATMKDDDCLFLARNNFLEETYFSWSIIPLVGGDGSVKGLYNPAFEKTRRKIAERRMLTLREVGERTAIARDLKSFWQEVLVALEYNEHDTPFVIIYSVAEENDSDSSSMHSNSMYGGRQCYLEGALGVPAGHAAAPEQIDLKHGTEGFGRVFREVMLTNRTMVLDFEKGEPLKELLPGIEWRGFGDPAKAAVICPIHPTTSDSTLGFLVIGINPRRPYDDDYALFVQLLSRQLATSLASVVLFEEEIKRGQRAARLAALDRIELSEQLAARTQEAIESETKFTRMAEFAPVGMFIADPEGHVTYCNDTWYDITNVPKDSSADRWLEYVTDADKELVTRLWDDLIHIIEPVTAEFRFKGPWVDPNGKPGDTWVLFSAFPEKYHEGTLKSVFGSITNISQQKWAEGFQKRKMEEAVELKRQQENFIDITSHEMRNPLSAILQCADMVLSTLNDIKARSPHNAIDLSVLESNIDATQTIVLCGLHQKRIIDDVLTMSKLDSALVMVTPVDVQPLTVVQRALKMFESEMQTADIHMDFIIDDSFKTLGIDWVRCDPFRVLQVLINLTTNAIKFTTTQKKRTIKVTLAASLQKPSEQERPVVQFFPPRSKSRDITRDVDWGAGDDVYIQFMVEDTGRGLTEDEKKLLFMRFSQASPRTHVQYGGSGLGLFISRELTELQGGEIGVASESGKGSTFAFFVKARRSTRPAEPLDTLPLPHPGSLVRKPSDAGAKVSQSSAGSAVASAAAVPSLSSPSPRIPEPPKARDFAPGAGATTKSGEQPLRVLIVEDNLVNQQVLAKQLRMKGCIVHVANHGGEALDRLRHSSFWAAGPEDDSTIDQDEMYTLPRKDSCTSLDGSAEASDAKETIDLDVVLMDQEMPVMDGLTCTRKIRELENAGRLLRHVPIIAVTANARTEQIQTAMEAGMDDVVSKPFRIPDLLPKMGELVHRLAAAGI